MPADALPIPRATGVDTATVEFGPYRDASGSVLFAGLAGTVTPTAAARVGGTIVAAVPVPVTLGDDGYASVPLARGLTYVLAWDAPRFAPTPGDRTFTVPLNGPSPAAVEDL